MGKEEKDGMDSRKMAMDGTLGGWAIWVRPTSQGMNFGKSGAMNEFGGNG